MKMKSIFTLISALSFVLLAGSASADVAGFTSNIKAQTVEKVSTKWLDPVGPPAGFWLAPASGDLFLTAFDGSRAETHATHGGFYAPSSSWYNVRVEVRSTGAVSF